jgi:transglutaminase-like putative cysteine protease
MKLMINHQTHYQYTEQAKNSVQYIKMMPFDNRHQKVHYWDISVPGERQMQRDAFNNLWMTCSQRFPYQSMTIMAQGVVEINPESEQGIEDDLNPYIFLQPTQSTLCNAEMKAFAHQYVPATPTRNDLIDLSAAILEHMPYTPEATSVHTSAIDAFSHQQGVCQDHSHVMIAMCKALGLPARYISGYLYSDNISHLASHAWAEVYIEDKWHCFDVSNQLFTPKAHIYVAIGRDYWDVAPVRGVREQGGEESMYSIVQVLSC